MSSIRIQKVEELLRAQLSILIRQNLPEEFGIITVTNVAVTADLKQAQVHIVLVDKDQEKKVLTYLSQKTPIFQHTLGRTLSLRYTPRLNFNIDRSESKANRVEELLKEIDRDA